MKKVWSLKDAKKMMRSRIEQTKRETATTQRLECYNEGFVAGLKAALFYLEQRL